MLMSTGISERLATVETSSVDRPKLYCGTDTLVQTNVTAKPNRLVSTIVWIPLVNYFFHKGITARYETVCDGCPSWGDCHSCDVSEPELEPVCDFALDHSTSDEPGNTLNTLSANEGYWRAIPDTDNILPCYNVAACGGGRTGTETFCGDGYTGACKTVFRAHSVVFNLRLPTKVY